MSGGFGLKGGFMYVPGGGSSYDDTAVLAAIAALQDDIEWNLNSAASGSDAGPSTSVLISSLSATKRSHIQVKWTQSGAALTTVNGLELEPNDNAGEGDGNSVRLTNVGGDYEDLTKSLVGGVNVISSLNSLDIYLDPVAKIGWAWHHSGLSGATGPRAQLSSIQWSTAGITSIRLTCIAASATLTSTTWVVRTENT